MKKTFERFGYTATIIGDVGECVLLTIKNPMGLIVKQTEYKNFDSARAGWSGWCVRHGMRIEQPDQDTVVIDINVPDPEEPVQIIKEPASTTSKIANNLPLTAIIDFNFTNTLNLSLAEWIADINNRIKSGEYHPSEIVRIRLVPNA